jgi:excisionase family DNA binding protein
MDMMQPSSMRPPSTTKNLQLPNLVDIQAVACSFGISMRQVRRFVADGQIPYVRVGHLIRFDPEELATWIDKRRSGHVRPETATSGSQGRPKVGEADP